MVLTEEVEIRCYWFASLTTQSMMPSSFRATSHMSQDPWPMFKTWSPHTSFILKGSQVLGLQLKGWFQIQDVKSKNIKMKYKTRITLCAYIIWYVFHVQCEGLRMIILTLLLVMSMPYVCWFLWWACYIERTSSDVFISSWGCNLKGCLEGQIAFERHRRLQSWTLEPRAVTL